MDTESIHAALRAFLEWTLRPTPTVIILGIAIVLLVPILVHILFDRATSYSVPPSVVLIGPSGAGKTALLTLYERGPLSPAAVRAQPALTHTSQVAAAVELAVLDDEDSPGEKLSFRENLDAREAKHRKFLLVDTPGHAKLRHEALDRLRAAAHGTKKQPQQQHKQQQQKARDIGDANSKVAAVVFVVDAAALGAGGEEGARALAVAAEYLYEVLLILQRGRVSTKTSTTTTTPLLVAANKLDLFTALPAQLVRANLEAEMTRVRRARSRALLDSSVGAHADADEDDDWLGEPGSEKFQFAQMRAYDVEVDLLGGNVVGEGGPGVDGWWSWIGNVLVRR